MIACMICIQEQLQTDVADASKNFSESDDSSDKSPRAFRSKGADRAVEVSSSASDMEQQSRYIK